MPANNEYNKTQLRKTILKLAQISIKQNKSDGFIRDTDNLVGKMVKTIEDLDKRLNAMDLSFEIEKWNKTHSNHQYSWQDQHIDEWIRIYKVPYGKNKSMKFYFNFTLYYYPDSNMGTNEMISILDC